MALKGNEFVIVQGVDAAGHPAGGAGVAPFGATIGQFGSGTAFAGEAGNVSVQVSAAGISPGSTGNDNVLAVYSLPANSLDHAGSQLSIQASGSFAANGNTKRVKLIFAPSAAVVGSAVTGGTTIADTAAVTTSGGGWSIGALVTKYGALGANTQLAVHEQAQVGGAVAALLAPATLTATETGAILIAVTGNATTTATDIVMNLFLVNGAN